MATPTAIGITLVSNPTAQSVEITAKGEVKTLIDKDGKFVKAAVQDPTIEFSVRGKGATCPMVLGILSSNAPGSLSGKVIVTSTKNSTNNDDWEEWEYSGSAYPSAT